MTADEARLLHDRITAAQGYVMWFVTGDSTGAFTARAMVADTTGGHQKGGDLVAGTIEELRAMLPPGLTRCDRTMMMVRDVVETWD